MVVGRSGYCRRSDDVAIIGIDDAKSPLLR